MKEYEIWVSKDIGGYAPGPVHLAGKAYGTTFRDAVVSFGMANMQFGRDVDPDTLTWWYRALWPTKEEATINNYKDHLKLREESYAHLKDGCHIVVKA